MSYVSDLRRCKSLSDFANLLGYSPSGLAYIVYRIPESRRYRTFYVPKKGGGVRVISAPDRRLKRLQRILSEYLTECFVEIESNSRRSNSVNKISNGFLPGRSIMTNANPHKQKRYVFNLDLKEFFPSIHFGRIVGFFTKNNKFRLQNNIAMLIAKICCHEGRLPQGSPASPIVSNLIGAILDVRLARLAKRYGCFYTRYADDISFSTNLKSFPKPIAAKGAFSSIWKPGEALRHEIERAGFQINKNKTRMHFNSNRQTVTGLVVNKHPNTPSNYYRIVRAQCNSYFNTGSFYNSVQIKRAFPGKVALQFYRIVPKLLRPLLLRYKPLRLDKREYYSESVEKLEGKLSHIVNVELYNRKMENNKSESAKFNLYEKFLFFKFFVNNELPVIICEGKTDVIYLKSIFSVLGDARPHLYQGAVGGRQSRVHVLSIESKAASWLGISGGTGNLKNFVQNYKKARSRYRFQRKGNPVIILVDNDSGSTSGLYGIVSNKSGLKLNIKHHEKIYNIEENLYLVPTPPLGGTGESCIENFFKDDALKKKLGTREFTLSDDFDPKKYYGKDEFSRKVIMTGKGELDFSGFAILLDRLEDAIADGKSK